MSGVEDAAQGVPLAACGPRSNLEKYLTAGSIRPRPRVVDISDSYARAIFTKPRRPLHNPDHVRAEGVSNFDTSPRTACDAGTARTISACDGNFIERRWQPPIHDRDAILIWVEDVTTEELSPDQTAKRE